MYRTHPQMHLPVPRQASFIDWPEQSHRATEHRRQKAARLVQPQILSCSKSIDIHWMSSVEAVAFSGLVFLFVLLPSSCPTLFPLSLFPLSLIPPTPPLWDRPWRTVQPLTIHENAEVGCMLSHHSRCAEVHI